MKRLLASLFFVLTSVFFLNINAAEAATGTVTPSTVAFANTVVGQNSATTVITVTRVAPVFPDVTANLALSSIALSDSVNFSLVAGGTCTSSTVLTGGAGSVSCTVNVRANPVTSGVHTASLDIGSNATNGPLSAALSVNGVTSIVEFSSPTYQVGESGGSVTLTLTRTGDTSVAVDIPFTLIANSASGPGGGANDFNTVASPVNFLAAQTVKTIVVPINTDTTVETNETFNVVLGAPSNASATVGTDDNAQVTIIDDDGPTTFQLSAPIYTVGESAGTAHVVVTRSGNTSGTPSVTFVTSNDTAISGSDYTNVNTVLNFAVGEIAKDVPISITSDTTIEGNEAFNVTLSAPANAVLGAQLSSQVVIVDDDSPEAVIEFSAPTYLVGESGGPAHVIAVRSGNISTAVSATVKTFDNTAIDGNDYSGINTTVNFAAGEIAKDIPVTILGDTSVEADESFNVVLSAPSGAVLGDQLTSTVTLIDDDGDTTFNIEKPEYVIGEGGAQLAVTVIRSGLTDVSQSVDVNTTDVSAIGGTDYTDVSPTTLTFNVGQTSRTILIPITQDTTVETSETFSISLASPTAGTVLGAQSTASATIIDDDSSPSVQFLSAEYNVAENGNFVTITAVRTGPVNTSFDVDYQTSDGTASSATDYTSASNTLSFNSGQVVKTFTVSVTDDTNIEPTEYFFASLLNPVGVTLGAQDFTQVDIIDNDSPTSSFSFEKPVYTVGESDGNVLVTVVRSGDTSASASVDVFTSDLTAFNGSDYSGISQFAPVTVNFSSGQVIRTVGIGISNDAVVENTESFDVSLTNPVGATLGSETFTQVDILDDDLPTSVFEFSQPTYTFGENAGTAHVIVTRSGNTSTTSTVQFFATDESAVSGTDYNVSSGTLTFNPGEITKSIDVGITNDSSVEANETFLLSLSNPSVNAVLGVDQNAQFTIVDDDAASSVIQLSAPIYNVGESAGTAHVIAIRSGSTASAVSATVNTSDDTALAGSDYNGISGGTVSFAAGEIAVDIPVTITGDTAVESNETFNVTLSAPVGAVLGAQQSSQVTIVDDDGQATFSFSAPTVIAGEADGLVHLTVLRSGNTTSAANVNWATADGSAIAGTNYNTNGGGLNFAPGEIAQDISVLVLNDGTPDPTLTFSVLLSGPSSGAVLGNPQVETVSIVDTNGPAAFSFSAPSVIAGEADGLVHLTVIRSGNTTSATNVNWATADGSAVAGTNYNTNGGGLNFAPGEIAQDISVLVLNDGTPDPTLTFSVILSGPSAGSVLGNPQVETVSIVDNNGPSTFSFSPATAIVGEADGTLHMTVIRSGNTTSAANVNWATVQDGSAVAGTNYNTNGGGLNFAPGEIAQDITVTILNDGTPAPTLTFSIQLSGPSAGSVLGNPQVALVSIVDNNGPSTIQLSAPLYTIGESAGTAHVIAIRSGNATNAVSATVNTSDDTALAGSDYNAVSGGTVSFAAGEIAVDIPVTVTADTTVEGNETFNITLSAPTGGAVLGPQQSSSVLIVDDDGASTIQFAQPTYSFGEGGVSGVVIVTRSGNPNGTVGVTVTETDLTATDGSDFTLAPTSPAVLTFNPGELAKTITVSLVDDPTVEPTETFRLDLSAPTGGASVGGNILSEVSIVDNEGQATVQFGQANYVVSEGIGTFTAIVTRSGDASTAVDVDVVPVDVTAVNGGTDYTLANPTPVHFNAGETTKSVSIGIVDDSAIEQTESFLLTFDAASLSSSAVLGAVSTSQVDIVDNDGNSTVEFKQAGYSFGEGLGQGVVFAIRSGDASQSVTVPLTATDVTATGGGTDYNVSTVSVTFGVGESVKTVLVDLIDDTSIEPTESFLLEFGTPTAGSAILGVNSIAEVDILDNDGSATFNLEKSEYVIGEGGVNLAVTVTRSSSTAVAQDVDVNTDDVSALAGADYTDISTTTLNFGVGVTTQTVLIPILEDTTVEDSETFTIEIGNPTNGALLGVQSTALATIIDNDGDATLDFNPADYAFSEGLGVVTLKVIRSGDSSGSVTVPFAVAPISATTPADFSVTTVSPLTFAPGVTSQLITVTLADDAIIEPTESFVVTLSPPTTGSAVLGVDSTAEVQIIDNDGGAAIEFSKTAYSFDEGAGTVTVLAIRSGDISTAVGATIAAQDVSATGADYSLITGSPISFAAFETAKPVTLTLNDDSLVETTETFNLVLSAPTGGAVLGADSVTEVSIDDNDNAGILAFSDDTFAFRESIGTAPITVTRTGGSDGAVSADCSTINRTATAPDDFTALNAVTLSWADGDTAPKTCDVAINDDFLKEDSEAFSVTLGNATGDAVIGSVNVADVLIVDNDEPGTISFSSNTYGVEEGSHIATLNVLRKGGTTGKVTVDYATVSGTATSPADFDTTTGTLTLGDGDASTRFISIPIHDTDIRTPRTFIVVLSNPTGGAKLGDTPDDPIVARVDIGSGKASVPDTAGGNGGCSLARGDSPTGASPAALVAVAALLMALLRFDALRRNLKKALRPAALAAVAVSLLALNGSWGCNKKPEVPAEAVQALQRLVSDAEDILDSVKDVSTCDAFNQVAHDLNANEIVPCSTGRIQVSALVTECVDSPFEGHGALVAVNENCVDATDGTTVDGTVTHSIVTDGTNAVTFSSANATVNGVSYPVGGVTVTVPDGEAATCEGVLTVLERPCTVTPDCSTCAFLD